MKPSVNIVENSIQKVYETRFKFAQKDVKDTEKREKTVFAQGDTSIHILLSSYLACIVLSFHFYSIKMKTRICCHQTKGVYNVL